MNWMDSDGEPDSRTRELDETKKARQELKSFKKAIGVPVSDATGTAGSDADGTGVFNAKHPEPNINVNPLEPNDDYEYYDEEDEGEEDEIDDQVKAL